jgi:hypothetical protein
MNKEFLMTILGVIIGIVVAEIAVKPLLGKVGIGNFENAEEEEELENI